MSTDRLDWCQWSMELSTGSLELGAHDHDDDDNDDDNDDEDAKPIQSHLTQSALAERMK
ncbi:hypothetical protein MMC29_007794, partial [Sticta canariensis]|nr:hypothetical protein [Sticta canariensis]